MNEALVLGSLRQHELIAAARDLNHRLEAEMAARQQTATELAAKARLLDLTQDAIIVRGVDGRIAYWNHGAEELYGWSCEEAVGGFSNKMFKTIYPQPLKEITEELHRVGSWAGEMIHTKRDGQQVTVLVRKVLDRDSDGNPAFVLQSITDISERKRAEAALRIAEELLADRAIHLEKLVAKRTKELTRAHAQLLEEADTRKRMEAEIAGAIEGERERLGQELHDGVVQELTGMAMLLHVLALTLKKSDPAGAKEARRLWKMMETAHGNARDLAKNFYPVELEHHGLLVALEGIAERTRQLYGIPCMVVATPQAGASTKDATSVQIFRIAQEAVQNAAKHGQASKILIRLSKKKDSWLLTVKDDGIGLPCDQQVTDGMGLRIMQYRAGIIHGKLAIGNADDGGVLVSCSAPIHPVR
jgi:PAS domain S-box-containing protein